MKTFQHINNEIVKHKGYGYTIVRFLRYCVVCGKEEDLDIRSHKVLCNSCMGKMDFGSRTDMYGKYLDMFPELGHYT